MKKYLIIFIFVLFLGLFLRLYGLTAFPIFGDEAIYIKWAQQMRQFPELRFVPLSDGKQPLFMWSIIPFLKVFDDPLFAGRFVSVISGMFTMVGISVLTLILFNKNSHKTDIKLQDFTKYLKNLFDDKKAVKASLVASLMYAVSPYTIFFDRMALADPMLSMFIVWTLIFSILTILFRRLDTAIIAGFALGGGLLTKSPAVFFAILIPSVLLFRIFKDNKIEFFDKNTLLLTPLFIVIYVISYGMYNILRLGPNFNQLSERTLDYVHPYSHILDSPLDPLLPFLDRILGYFLSLGPGVVIVLAILGIIKLLQSDKASLIILLIWFLVPVFVVAEFSRTMTARYVYFSVPYLFILASASVKYRQQLEKVINVGIGIIVLVSLSWTFTYLTSPLDTSLPPSERSGYLQEWTSGIGNKEVVDYIQEELRDDPDSEILIGTEGYFGTLPQGLEIYFENEPRVQIIGLGLGIVNVPDQLRESLEEGKRTFLVINEPRNNFDLDNIDNSITVSLIDSYPRLAFDDGRLETLHFYELSLPE